MNMRRSVWCNGAILLILVCTRSAVGRSPVDDAPIVKDFEARVSTYIDLHKTQAGDAKPTDSPQKLEQQRQQIAARMRAARPDARQGDIFTPQIADYFRRQIAAILAGHDGAKVRASLHHAEPMQGIPLQVNGRYPQGVPLQSTPPTLLLNLPRLPRELQYRIVNRDLVLYDATADLIVDFIPNAIPSS